MAPSEDLSTLSCFSICISLPVLILCGVIAALWRRGRSLQITVCVYIVNLTATQLLMSELSTKTFSYKFPGHVTVLHFISVWLYSIAYWSWMGDLGKCHPRSLGSASRFVATVVPISVSLPVAVAFNNVALTHLAAGFNSIISALSPVTTAVLSVALGCEMPRIIWAGLFVSLVGALVVLHSEAKITKPGVWASSQVGIVFALVSVIFRSLKSVLQDKLLNTHQYGKPFLDKSISVMHLWAVQAPWMVMVSLIYALATESSKQALSELTPQNAALIVLTCITATMLNILGARTLQALGATHMQAIGKLNVVVTVALSVTLMGERLPLRVLPGAAAMLVGVALIENANRQKPLEVAHLKEAGKC